MEYRNTQYGKWYLLIPFVIGLLLIVDALAPGPPIPWYAYAISTAAVGVSILCFTSLTVRDGGDRLVVQFGPIPLIWKTIPYRSITRIEKGRTRFIDGWGLHFSRTGGTVLNVWGYECVRIWCGKRLYSIGTDDPEGLFNLLENKVREFQDIRDSEQEGPN